MGRLNTTKDIEEEILAIKKTALAGLLVACMALLVGLFAIFLG